jgi:hypothetical protein
LSQQRDSSRAERAVLGLIRRKVHGEAGVEGNADSYPTARPVRENAYPDHGSSRLSQALEYFLDRAARGDDVVDDEHPLARLYLKAPSQDTTSLGPSFRIDGIDPQLPSDFIGEDDPASRRTDDQLDVLFSKTRGDHSRKGCGSDRVLEYSKFLEVLGTMAAARVDEVTLQQGP